MAIDSGAIAGTAIPTKRRLGRRLCASVRARCGLPIRRVGYWRWLAVLDGQSRGAAARVGGMVRQTLRDWVHAYNAKGPNGLFNATSPAQPPKLTKAQKERLPPIIVAGPIR